MEIDLADSGAQSESVSNSWLVVLLIANYHIFPSQRVRARDPSTLTQLFSSSYISSCFDTQVAGSILQLTNEEHSLWNWPPSRIFVTISYLFRNWIVEHHEWIEKIQFSTNPYIYRSLMIRGICGLWGTSLSLPSKVWNALTWRINYWLSPLLPPPLLPPETLGMGSIGQTSFFFQNSINTNQHRHLYRDMHGSRIF